MLETKIESWQGRGVLVVAHVAGMIDLVALPVWVGTALIGQYHFSAPLAGAMVTLYLVAVAVASLVFAPKFNRIEPRKAASLGYAAAALAFIALTQTRNPVAMIALHAVAGLSAGTGLSFIHGTIGRSARPHRLFAIVTLGLGAAGILFTGVAQTIVPQYGGPVLFALFAGLMGAAALATGFAYPRAADVGRRAAEIAAVTTRGAAPMAQRVWWAIFGVTAMAVSQAMMFSFVERIGVAHGYAAKVRNVLVTAALVNLAAAGVAGLLERRLKALKVALVGAAAQSTLALIIVFSDDFAFYAFGVIFLVSAMIISHTFVFGWLSANDSTSRAVALTPAMLMTGAAVGPLLGGVLVATFGSSSLGPVALLLDSLALICFLMAVRLSRKSEFAALAVKSP